ncbi:Snu56p [Lachancea thermotolerans CBS 6340]|uniref:KLTH0E10780p n=1 Tax=Lachancea thermotolerans (strain ATCC 56472 / CBS 6340 / NRRL Y-8284) TaxID=559295 RepID=C5DI97_LACTC|nr:KLTH0E10780p [Lachancea thermotolerans CBS 6340]CAR23508.1 KLTH0E10780p [Lachancea thermotolerans CBS 6340]
MGVKKRPFSGGQGSRSNTKKPDVHESSSLLSIAEAVSQRNTNVTKVIKKSQIFVSLTALEAKQLSRCKLEELANNQSLQLIEKEGNVSYLDFSNFSSLQLALVLCSIFGIKSKQWLGKSTSDSRSIPRNIPLRGSFYIHKTCKVPRDHPESLKCGISVSRVVDITNFVEVSIDIYGATSFIEGLTRFASFLKFQKSENWVKSEFYEGLRNKWLVSEMSIAAVPFLERGLLVNNNEIAKTNSALIEKTRKSLEGFAQDLIKNNNETPMEKRDESEAQGLTSTSISERKSSSNTSRYSVSTHDSATRSTKAGSGRTLDPQSRSLNSNFLTQEQITDYCKATIQASIEAVKSKSPYQIIKTYIKCPRVYYVDLLYEHLNRLRSETNCNIVVLNLNNVHESTSWFGSLKVSKFTSVSSIPHPSTVRVVSIGGIGEHNVKSLQLLLKLFEENPAA